MIGFHTGWNDALNKVPRQVDAAEICDYTKGYSAYLLAYGFKEPREMTGFFATLTPEQLETAMAYKGDDNHGPEYMLDVSVEDGKYRIIQTSSRGLEILRYDEPWLSDIKGAKCIISLACEVEKLREQLANIKEIVDNV